MTKFFKKKLKSKKGFSLVESICGIMLLAVITVGVLNSVAFSREMIYTNNAREKASDKAQLVADEIVASATGVDPAGDDAAVSYIVNKMNEIANTENPIGTVKDIQTDDIGKVYYMKDGFETPALNDPDPKLIQYTLEPVKTGSLEETKEKFKVDGVDLNVDVRKAVQVGWKIKVRVYYGKIGGEATYRTVDFDAFAAKNQVTE